MLFRSNEVIFLGLSEDLALKFGVKDKDLIKLKVKDKALSLSVRVDKDLVGAAYLPYFDEKIDTLSFFEERVLKASLEKIGGSDE